MALRKETETITKIVCGICYGGDTLSKLETGACRLLYPYQVYQHTWYKTGRQKYFRLLPEYLASLDAALHADINAWFLSHEMVNILSHFCGFRVSYCERHGARKAIMHQQDKHKLACSSDSALYHQHVAIILAYARSHTASWQDAEDLTLEVFLTALEHDNLSWLTCGQQLVWLRRVAHNKLIDGYRRPSQPLTVPLEHVIEHACRDEALTPEQLVLRREELELLYEAVSKLSLQQQQILQLRFGEGLRFAEIAILLNKREASVRKICSRSLALLRRIYEQ